MLEQYWLVLYWLVRINSIYSPITNHYHCNSLLVVSVPALGTSTSKTSPLDGRLRSELTGMIWSYGILEFLEVLAPKKKKCSLEKKFLVIILALEKIEFRKKS